MTNPAKVFDDMKTAMKAAKGRAPKGSLREMVIQYLKEHATSIADGLDAHEVARGIGVKNVTNVSVTLSKLYSQGRLMRAKSHIGRGYRYWYVPPQLSARASVKSELGVLLKKTEHLLSAWREFGGAVMLELQRAEEMRARLRHLEGVLKGKVEVEK